MVVFLRLPQLDILVNNAGRSQRAAFQEIPLEVDKEMFDVNVFGTVSLTRCVVSHFKERGQHGHPGETKQKQKKAAYMTRP